MKTESLTPDDIRRIALAVSRGDASRPLSALAESCGVSRQAVNNWLVRGGCPHGPADKLLRLLAVTHGLKL